MLPTKKNRRKEGQRGSAIIIIIFFMVLVLLGISWILLQQLEETLPEEDEATEAPPSLSAKNQAQLERLLPQVDIPQNEDTLAKLFPADFSAIVTHQDINNDGQPESVLVEYHPNHDQRSPEFTETGYERIISRLVILSENPQGELGMLLRISQNSMIDQHGERLIAQEPAPHGYAFRVVPYAGDPYTAEVLLIELAILDENLSLASDDLVIYWKPSENRYAATNAFGQPGTF